MWLGVFLGALLLVGVRTALGRQDIQRIEQVVLHVGIGVLLNEERRRGVADERREKAVVGHKSLEPTR